MKKKGKNTKTTITAKKKSLIHLGVHVTWMPLSPFHMNSANVSTKASHALTLMCNALRIAYRRVSLHGYWAERNQRTVHNENESANMFVSLQQKGNHLSNKSL